MSDHKTCPWCGSEPEFRIHTIPTEQLGDLYEWVFGCLDPDCAVNPSFFIEDFTEEGKQAAFEKWDDRSERKCRLNSIPESGYVECSECGSVFSPLVRAAEGWVTARVCPYCMAKVVRK